MSVNALRALVLLLNLALLGLVGWAVYEAFIHVDESRYVVEPPDLRKYEVQEKSIDESQQKRELYKAITRTFDPPPPPPPAPTGPSEAAKPTRADPRQIKVVAINYSPDQSRASALIQAPLATEKDGKYFQVGVDLGAPNMGFEAYKDCKIKAIAENEIVILDQKGQEVRIPGPPRKS